jgi:hypothetical protein
MVLNLSFKTLKDIKLSTKFRKKKNLCVFTTYKTHYHSKLKKNPKK